jgi:hypothetical protein
MLIFLGLLIAIRAEAATILLNEGFESAAWQANWTSFEYPENMTITTHIPNSGHQLQVRVPLGEDDGAAVIWRFAAKGYAPPDEAWLRFYAWFDNSWTSSPARDYLASLPGYAGQGWAVYMYSNSSAGVGFRIHQLGNPGGELIPWGYALQRNQWYAFEFRVKLNTPGQANGIVQGWLNNALIFNRGNFAFRTDLSVKVDTMWGGVYTAPGTVADRNMTLYLDAITIAPDQICQSCAPPPAPAPPPPCQCP